MTFVLLLFILIAVFGQDGVFSTKLGFISVASLRVLPISQKGGEGKPEKKSSFSYVLSFKP